MDRYLLHMPVYGSIDLEIQANSMEEAYTKYEEIRESILNSEIYKLSEDSGGSYVIKLNKKELC